MSPTCPLKLQWRRRMTWGPYRHVDTRGPSPCALAHYCRLQRKARDQWHCVGVVGDGAAVEAIILRWEMWSHMLLPILPPHITPPRFGMYYV